MITQTPDLTTSTSTTSPQEVAPRPDAAAQWRDVIERLQAYQAECELSDQLDRESAQQDG